jgi:iron complex transport system ATP-binding protein
LISALDATVRDRPGLGIVLATHHLEEIPPSASHAALLRQGCFVASGPIEEVLDAGNLERCFGLGIEVLRRGGRWFGVARASREPD